MENKLRRISTEEKDIVYAEGERIYQELTSKYNNNVVCNTLCLSLILLIYDTAPKDDWPYLIQLVYSNIKKNLENIDG